MYGKFQKHLQDTLQEIKEAGLYKTERNIVSAQSAEITLQDGSRALNFCANNYLVLPVKMI
ncbi:MAG: glycine C-acetyltransferase, partial [Bacteroidales bacterium]|nr:glycine C-acetyltransferase [Bacteroidales bacterium]